MEASAVLVSIVELSSGSIAVGGTGSKSGYDLNQERGYELNQKLKV